MSEFALKKRPHPWVPPFWVEYPDRETMRLHVGATIVGEFDLVYDYDSVEPAEKVFREVAKALGAEIKE